MPTKIPYSRQRSAQIESLTRQIVSELPNDVYDYILALSSSTQPLTRYAYVHDLRLFLNYLARENPVFGKKQLIAWDSSDFAKITARDINMFLDYLSVYFNSDDVMVTNQELGKMRKFYSVRSFFKWMYKQSRIKNDVTALVETPKRHEKPILRLDVNEVNRMLNAIESGDSLSNRQRKFNEITRIRDFAIVTLFLGTGIRVSELVGLDTDDIDIDAGSFMVTRKGGNQVILYLPDEVIKPLRDYIEYRNTIDDIQEGHENAFFLSLQKRRITTRSVENLVKKYAAIAAPLKKRISPHKLRSTFGTNLYHETGDIYLVADVLGHSDINTTRRHYAAMNEDHRKYAATRVKLGLQTETDADSEDDAGTPQNNE